MGYAVITRAGIAAHQARVPIGEPRSRALDQPVAGRFQPRPELRVLHHQFHVGIGEQQIIIGER